MLPTHALQPNEPLLEARRLKKHFPIGRTLAGRPRHALKAVDGVSLVLRQGETLGIVGESGSGKSTLGRLLVRLLDPTAGSLWFKGQDITNLRGRELRRLRRSVQIVFQDPYSSLDPTWTVGDTIGEALRIHSGEDRRRRARRVADLLDSVGLDPGLAGRYPHELSGGQRQRIAIARALSVDPEVIVCDEPVTALDVSTQAQIINLLQDLQQDRGLAYVFIAHDIGVVRRLSDRIAVMYLGKLVEEGDAETVTTAPLHPYTKALLSAIPIANPDVQRNRERIVLTGEIPSPVDPPSGCSFHPRCPHVADVCRAVEPQMQEVGRGQVTSCHLYGEPSSQSA